MSSYQFVNTLAQCYAEQAGQANQNTQDYYNMNYPNCYSPNLAAHAQYGQYSLMMSGTNGAAGAAANTGGGGTTGSSTGGTTGSDFNSSSNSAPGQRTSANQSPVTAQQVVGGAGPRLGSPQDLSRTSDGEGPAGCQSTTSGLGALNPTSAPKTPDTPVSSSTNQGHHPPLSPTSPSSSSKSQDNSTDRGGGGGGPGGGANVNSNNNNNSSSSNNVQKGSGSEGKSSTNNPPQIYPWMKRVHLGQSK